MERLAKENLNTAEEYDRIFKVREEKGIDSQDLRRWKRLLKYYHGGRLIDLGCLDSLVPLLAKEKYPKAEVWGIDIAKDAIHSMTLKYPRIYWETMDIYQTKFPSDYFYYAIAGEVIEHLEDPKAFIKESFRILRKNGVFAISTPLGESHLGEVDGERHLWSYTVQDLKDLLSSYGKVKLQVLGSEYFPIYKYHFPTLLAWCVKQ